MVTRFAIWDGGMQFETYFDASRKNGYVFIFDEGMVRMRLEKVTNGSRTVIFDK